MVGIEKTSLEEIEIDALAEFFDLLAKFDFEDKLASEPRSSTPREDLGPDSKSGKIQTETTALRTNAG